jgi:hypothetical protein
MSLVIFRRSFALRASASHLVAYVFFLSHHAALVIQVPVAAAPAPATADLAAASTAPTGLGLGHPG